MSANFIIRRPHMPVLTRSERKKAKETRAWALSAREKLYNAASKRKQYEDEIKEMYGLLLKEKVVSSLGQIPVDKLNEKKDGIKLGILKSNNVNTVRDAYDLGTEGLKKISGIGDVSARLIQENILRIYNSVAAETKVSLSDITASHEWDDVVGHLEFLIRHRELSERAEALLATYADVLDEHIMATENTEGAFKWFFTGKEKKLLAKESAEMLEELRVSGFVEQLDEVDAGFKKEIEVSEKSKERFKADPIPFFAYWDQIFGDNKTGLEERLDEFSKNILSLQLDTRGLDAVLRGYQVYGATYIISQKRVLLGDEMGLGKTMQALAAMVHLANCKKTHFLVLCPLSVVENWCREIRKFTHLETIVFYGDEKKCAQQWEDWISIGGVGITNFETARKIEPLRDIPIALMVVDEAHYIKNPGAKRTRNVMGLGFYAENLLFMTGTPIENRQEEMLSLISILQPSVANDIKAKGAAYNAAEFKKLVMPVYLRRVRKDVLKELPEKTEYEDWVRLKDSETEKYKEVLFEKGNDETAFGALMPLRRVSWNAGEDSSKLARLLEICAEAAEDDRRLIIFSFFKDNLVTVAEALGDKCAGIIEGSVSAAGRQEIIDRLPEMPAGSAIVAQITAGGVGLNIQSASVVIFCEPQIKPSLEDQALSRAYRMGQTKQVLVHRLLAADTVDERIMQLLSEKRRIFKEYAEDAIISKLDSLFTKEEISRIIEQERNFYSKPEKE